MRFAIRLGVETADGSTTEHAIAMIERPDGALPIDELGLRLEDAKAILAALQVAVVETQAHDFARRKRPCPCCGAPRRLKDHRTIRVRTPFGKLAVPSPRYRRCGCETAPDVAATDNARMIPNHAERRRHGEVVSTAFVEATINQVVTKRCCPGKQQRPWTPRGMHLLLQLRTLDGTLGGDFNRWRQERKARLTDRAEAA